MATLTPDQRNAIVARCRGLVATYFTTSQLRGIQLDDLGPAGRADPALEFHDHLRLSTLLPRGAALCSLLSRALLAPSIEQQVMIAQSRGRLDGPIDPASAARHAGRRDAPRTFHVRRVVTHHTTPENVLAASAARSLVDELQRLTARIQLPKHSSEAGLARDVLDAAQSALDGGPLAECSNDIVELAGDAGDALLMKIEERWRSRRISNRAYADIARWVRANRSRALGADGLLTGLAYSDDFDNRLFEIFTLNLVRQGLEAQGYDCSVSRPLHRAKKLPAMEFTHPDTSEVLDLFFQRAEGVVWTATAPRAWSGITGIPDVVLAPRSTSHPVVLIDAKNRDRGRPPDDEEEVVGRHGTSDELHKMLGYFTNFERRCRVGLRGPAGALVYSSTVGTTELWESNSEAGGSLTTIAVDPRDGNLAEPNGPAAVLLDQLLRSIGLLGGERPGGWAADKQLEELRAGIADDPETEEGAAQISAEVHEWLAANYGSDPTRVAKASQVLDAHMLGVSWGLLTDDERRFLATAEVFWEDHSGAANLDFGPVVLELAKVFESLAERLLVAPLKEWADHGNRYLSKVETIGDIRAELQRASELAPGVRNPKGARTLADFLEATGRWDAAKVLLPILNKLNPLRRAAAHPKQVTCATARSARAWILGVGPEPSSLSEVISALSAGPAQ